ncbi:UNKNOWN [Stylonychia lemnae]|uniref:Uncharacterized protein n=1 Tax=Stylonychia lemnae TaxID=5949 RepID=A0A078A1L1_STYLE|nr:UNKNOWN [Stylonychia lemnae]|eukprot:CDW74669.1 UNKNOWN [Stylonychia lemnae]
MTLIIAQSFNYRRDEIQYLERVGGLGVRCSTMIFTDVEIINNIEATNTKSNQLNFPNKEGLDSLTMPQDIYKLLLLYLKQILCLIDSHQLKMQWAL